MRRDPHSHADLDQGRTEHAHFSWVVDMQARELRGSVKLRLADARTGPLDLDTRGLRIERVDDAEGPLSFDLSDADPILGQRLRVQRERPTRELTITYRTGAATGLMWLEAAQTASGAPFMLSQCQAIHARSLAPLQDTPRARITYSAQLRLPEGSSAVMSAAPGATDADGSLTFDMPQPIPPYLLAIAVGNLASRDLGPRTRVWAEPGVVEQAAWEFADVERMLSAAEDLFGPYAWDRFDFVVLPPSFPLGGMENPRMTFLTPTLLAGDRSLVDVLAHELAHSWTGNLVTNADNEHFWLNEGWTVYAERRILEALYGTEAAVLSAALGRVQLDQVIARRAAEGRSTALTYPQVGLDPDDEFSLVPYEKGFLLLVTLEQAAGRTRFNAFTRAYIERFRFQSIDTATFVGFVSEQLGDLSIDLEPWLIGDGLPPEAPRFRSERLQELQTAADGFLRGTAPPNTQSTTELLYYLAALPQGLTAVQLERLDVALGLRETQNAELQSVWLSLAARAGLSSEDAALEGFVGTIGRGKLLRPVFEGLVAGGSADLATRLLTTHRPRLHGSVVGQLERVLSAAR